ncbi:MAG TPA: class I SAM-dependent methyltransferase [Usitatibacter sp.]|nr:class I SAM-dependent methyltransferase [Usitatibacter sp.]
MTSAQEITSCEVCGRETLQPVLDLGLHPLCDDLVPLGDPRVCKEYPIEILYCPDCTTAHQRFQVPKRELFPGNYHYRARFTADVLKGMSALVDSVESRLGSLQGKLVLDVGCNDGSLLGFFKAKGARTVGIEPTDAHLDARAAGHDVVGDFFTPQTARAVRAKHGRPDVITFTNVFAHIENLPEVLEGLRELMAPHTMLVIENHYLGAVLERNQFDTFYHEHPRSYSLTSLARIARSLDARLTGVEFPSRYGGNIRVFMNGPGGTEGDAALRDVERKEKSFGDEFGRMRSDIERWKSATKARLAALAREHGPLPAKAFPGRAAILVKLLDLDESVISAVYEKPGSLKIGHYLPGTRIPIRSDDDFAAIRDKSPVLVNFAWHIATEIRDYLRKAGFRGEIVDIVDPRDFEART